MTPRSPNSEFRSSATDPDATLPPESGGLHDIPSVGRTFGDYELIEEIARGGMGVVFKARQISLNRVVALKMILAGQLASHHDVQRFRLEAEAAANLDHPNILPIYDVGEETGQHYFSMKFVEGGTLADLLHPKSANTIKDDDTSFVQSRFTVIPLLISVARAVHFAHQRGILHRDIKPGNVLIDRDGTPFVTDFGLAKRADSDSGLTQTGAIVGTPSYMAPEQASSPKNTSTAADIYALGAVLYEALTSQPPFRASTAMETILQVINDEPRTPRSINSRVDADLQTITLKCLAKEPHRRYATAGDLADELDRWQRGEPILARPNSATEKAWRWAKRRPLVAALAGTIGLFLIVGIVGMSLLYARSEFHRYQAEVRLEAVKKLKDQAEVNEHSAKRYLYASNIGLATRAWDAGNAAETIRLLKQQTPTPGQPDMRSFEWHYLNQLCFVTGVDVEIGQAITNARLIADGQFAVLTTEIDPTIQIINLKNKDRKSIAGQLILGCTSKPDRAHGWTLFTGEVREIDAQESKPDPPPSFARKKKPGLLVVRIYDPATGQEVEPAKTFQVEIVTSSMSQIASKTRGPVIVAFAADAREFVTIADVVNFDTGDFATVTGIYRSFTSTPYQMTFQWHSLNNGETKAITDSGILVYGAQSNPFTSPALSSDGQKLAAYGLEVPSSFVGSIAAGVIAKLNSINPVIFRTERHRRRMDRWEQKSKSQFTYYLGFDPQGANLLAATQLNEIRILDAKTGDEQGILKGHNAEVTSVAYSPDGSQLATGSADTTVRVWNVKTSELLATCRGHIATIRDVCWNTEGTNVISIDQTGVVKTWQPERPPGPLKLLLPQRPSATAILHFMAFLADGNTILYDSTDFRFRNTSLELFDASSGKKLAKKKQLAGNVMSALNDGAITRVILGQVRNAITDDNEDRNDLTEWIPQTGQTRTIRSDIVLIRREATFSHDGKWVAIHRSEQKENHFVALQSLGQTETHKLLIETKPFVHFLDFTPDSKSLVLITNDGRLLIWNSETRTMVLSRQLPFVPKGGPGFTSDGQHIVVSDEQKQLQRVSLKDGRSQLICPGLPGAPATVLLTRDNQRVVLFFPSDREAPIRFYAMDGGQEVFALRAQELENFQAIAFNPDCTRLAARTESTIYVWDCNPSARP